MGLMDSLKTANKGLVAFASVLVAALVIWLGSKLASWLATRDFLAIGKFDTAIPLEAPGWIDNALTVVLGIPTGTATVEGTIIRLAIFIIIVFAMADIIEMFSTFKESTAWMIALGLGLIAGATRVVETIASVMGVTAGIGAVGIMVIIASAIVAAIVLNLGLGGTARAWRMKRQIDIEHTKSGKGAAGVADAIKGLKEVNTALKDKEL